MFKHISRLDSATEASYLLDLLEANCSRSEIEGAMSFQLDEEDQMTYFLTNRWVFLYRRFEMICGKGKALTVALHIRLRNSQENTLILKKLTYPILLLVSGVSVLYLFLFFIRPSIDPSRQAFHIRTTFATGTLQSIYIVSLLLIFSALLTLAYFCFTHRILLFKRLSTRFPNNPWRLKVSRRFAYLILQLHKLGLSTQEIYTTIRNFENDPILALISNNVLRQINLLGRIDDAFEAIDPTLKKLLLFENHPDFPARLERYDWIAKKRFDRQITRYAYCLTIFAYLLISFLILALYREMLFPLKALQALR